MTVSQDSPHCFFTGREIGSLPVLLEKYKLSRYLISDQVHGNEIFTAREYPIDTEIKGYDGLVTDLPDLALIIKHADCLPIFIQGQGVIAALHAGRVGTDLKISVRCVEQICEEFALKPTGLKAIIGPSVCNNCYPRDLWQENREQLRSVGLLPENIELKAICTACSGNKEYFSYRGDNHTKERNYSFIIL